jgi:hypothetical protein
MASLSRAQRDAVVRRLPNVWFQEIHSGSLVRVGAYEIAVDVCADGPTVQWVFFSVEGERWLAQSPQAADLAAQVAEALGTMRLPPPDWA